ncbi:hypothetical protein B0T26DRAFT_753799 [Lasiosphaeria miniovina]|uniref:Uncharacterized protein n=1 Tax=Lasiosphaeria miniovina TaxID=1954250 RepID=A0AA40AD80_9PEZI|nr:uncharacterized protein B0T26DRAFT_753799 [Lasiosphaeria miniovina]KAK0713711.1 hypothetical protein B0T26DRAFT_753799 [Lasiosphaeria miniovina]
MSDLRDDYLAIYPSKTPGVVNAHAKFLADLTSSDAKTHWAAVAAKNEVYKSLQQDRKAVFSSSPEGGLHNYVFMRHSMKLSARDRSRTRTTGAVILLFKDAVRIEKVIMDGKRQGVKLRIMLKHTFCDGHLLDMFEKIDGVDGLMRFINQGESTT